MSDPVRNFAISTVTVAPSPANSGTTLQVDDDSVFPDASDDGAFNAVIWPAGVAPSSANAEIIRSTDSTGTWAIERQQEGTAARSIVVGDQIMLAPTAKTITDIWSALAAKLTMPNAATNGSGEFTSYAGENPVGGVLLIGRDDGRLELMPIAGWTWDEANARWSQVTVGAINLTATTRAVGEDIGLVIGSAGLTTIVGHVLTLEGGRADETDSVGYALSLGGGIGRGNQVGGDVLLKTTRAGSSGHVTGEVLKAGNSSPDQEISGTLADVPALDGSFGGIAALVVDSSGSPQTVVFQLNGTITGEIGSGGTNTWDTVTGAYSFSFVGASTGPVLAEYYVPGDNAYVTDAQLRASDGAFLMKPPTSDPAIAGVLWNNAGTPTISAG